MITKRIIPCLDVRDGRVVKGVNFEGLRDVSSPVELGKFYSSSGADELVFLDITATNEKRKTTVEMVKKVAQQVFIPFTVGGGINSLDDMKMLLLAGADKVAINSAAVKTPDLINISSDYFGSQCIVVAIDAKRIDGDFFVFINAGKVNTGIKLSDWVNEVQKRGAGEILLTSMDADGTQSGFDIEMTKLAAEKSSIPVIASGGAGPNVEHFTNVFKDGFADAALAASIFHFNTLSVPLLKSELRKQSVEVRI